MYARKSSIDNSSGNSGPAFLVTLAILGLAIFILPLASTGCSGEEAGTGETGTPTLQTPVAAPEPSPGTPPATEQESPYGTGLTTEQTVGTIFDGVQLLDVRWADHGSYFRIVFDMGTAEGEPMLQPPHADASLEENGTQLRVLLGGIRSISDNPNAQSEEIPIENDLVTAVRRVPSGDDQALLYVVELSRPSTYALAGLGSPGRIVVDIIKS